MRSHLLATTLMLALPLACGGSEAPKQDTKGAAADEKKAGDEKAGDSKAADPKTPEQKAGDEKAVNDSETPTGAADTDADTNADTEAPTGGTDDENPTGGETAKPELTPEEIEKAKKAATTKLVKEIKSKRTKDARATKALAELEAAGATVREVAEAANARGENLSGERATKMFEWARDKDTSYPNPSYNLAKQTVLTGDTTATIAHLQEVKKRGGRKLLKQVGYDPLFEVVKDDPKVRPMIK
ncbi:MAG: hypothetical protein ACPG77_14080 [Nannocystaceae bacterium]